MSENFRFVLVDDVSVNNLLVGRTIQKLLPGASVSQFTDAGKAFEFLRDMEVADGDNVMPLVVLLDIYMPLMDGWNFLDLWSEQEEQRRKGVQVWILSSSISPSDKQRAIANSMVAGYLLKPFTSESINTIIGHIGSKVA